MIQGTDLCISPTILDMSTSLGPSFIIFKGSDFEQVVSEFPFRVGIFDCGLMYFEL